MTLTWRSYYGAKKKYFEVDSFEKPKYSFLPMHNHDYAEFFYIESGKGTHILNNNIQHVSKGDLILIHPYDDVHCISESDDNLVVLHVAIVSESLRFVEDRYFRNSREFWGKRGMNRVMKLGPLQQYWFESEVRTLQKVERSRIEIERFLLNLMVDINMLPRNMKKGNIPEWLSKACDKIYDPAFFCQGPKGFFLLANHSHEYVTRELRKYTNMKTTEIVNNARMKYAAKELVYTSKEIIDIVYNCGLESLSHFYKLFRNEFGITPYQYRQSHKLRLFGESIDA